jgi:hypothetical protein
MFPEADDAAAGPALLLAVPGPGAPLAARARPGAGAYAEVNGLKLYYEVHGRKGGGAPPLVMIHGAFGTIDNCFGQLIPPLAKQRQLIAVELQGHGRTADIDRPLRYEQLADDVAGLLAQIKVPQRRRVRLQPGRRRGPAGRHPPPAGGAPAGGGLDDVRQHRWQPGCWT